MRASCVKRAFTLIELLVVVAIIALLIAILVPALSRARDQARSASCLSNMKGLGIAVVTYEASNSDYLPPSAIDWASNSANNDLLYYPLLVDGALTNPSIAVPPGFNKTVPSSFPALSYRSVFVCPSTPNVLYTTGGNHDGYAQSSSWYYDNTKTAVVNGDAPISPTASNSLIIQASYGFDGSVTTDGGGTSPYGPNGMIFIYPLQMMNPNTPGHSGFYSAMSFQRRNVSVSAPGRTVFMYDGNNANPYVDIKYRIMGRHGQPSGNVSAETTGRVNIAFFDGHAESAFRSKLPSFYNGINEMDTQHVAFSSVQSSGHWEYIWRMDQQQ